MMVFVSGLLVPQTGIVQSHPTKANTDPLMTEKREKNKGCAEMEIETDSY